MRGILAQIPVEGYEKLLVSISMGCAWLGERYAGQDEIHTVACYGWVGSVLLGLISRDKNRVQDITFTLSGGTIDNLSIDNKGA